MIFICKNTLILAYNGYELMARYHKITSLRLLANCFPDALKDFVDDKQLECKFVVILMLKFF